MGNGFSVIFANLFFILVVEASTHLRSGVNFRRGGINQPDRCHDKSTQHEMAVRVSSRSRDWHGQYKESHHQRVAMSSYSLVLQSTGEFSELLSSFAPNGDIIQPSAMACG